MPLTSELTPAEERAIDLDMARLVLSPEDAAAFTENEGIVREHLGTFFAVGYALHLISKRRWYRAKGYVSFASYCLGEWQMGPAYAYRLMAAAEAVATIAEAEGEEVSPVGDTLPACVPSRESVARPLTRLDACDQPAAWEAATQAARAEGLDKPAARHVAAEVRRIEAAATSIHPPPDLPAPAAPITRTAPPFEWRTLHRLIFEYRDSDSDGEARTLFAEIDQLPQENGGAICPPSPDARQKVFRIWIGGERYGAAATLDDAKALVEAQFRSAAGIGGDQ